MGLALSTVRHASEQFAKTVTTPLPQGRCTIGRGDDADITLEDSTRQISRVHAVVTGTGDTFVLSVISKVNPVFVNGTAVAAGQTRILAPGDELSIGDYVFQVMDPGQPQGGGSVLPAPVAAAPSPDPFGSAPASGGSSPLDDILGRLPSREAPPPARAPLDSLLGGPTTVAPVFNEILGGLGIGHADPARPAAGAGGAPSAQFNSSGGVTSLTGLFGMSPGGLLESLGRGGGGPAGSADPLGLNRGARVGSGKGFGDGGRGSDHVHPVNLPFSPPPVNTPAAASPHPAAAPAAPASTRAPAARALPDKDILDLLGPPAAGRASRPDPLDVLGLGVESLQAPPEGQSGIGQFVPPLPAPASALVDFSLESAPAHDTQEPPAARLDPPAGVGAGAAAAVALFLKGAGIEGVSLSEADAQTFLVESGALCRVAVEGVMALLLARATLRQELRAPDRTMLAAFENNPLKMMETPEEAIQFVFKPATRGEGFLAPAQAVADAFKDLKTHEIAVMAGMRSALMGSIKRFEPPNIEKRFELVPKSKVSMLANRKAQLWEFFVEFHAKTTDDAQDNFDRVFGADFLRAYSAQVKLLK